MWNSCEIVKSIEKVNPFPQELEDELVMLQNMTTPGFTAWYPVPTNFSRLPLFLGICWGARRSRWWSQGNAAGGPIHPAIDVGLSFLLQRPHRFGTHPFPVFWKPTEKDGNSSIWLSKWKHALTFERSVQDNSLQDARDVANEETQSAEDQLAAVAAESCPSPMQYTHKI